MPRFPIPGQPGMWSRFGVADNGDTLFMCDGCRHTFQISEAEISEAEKKRGEPAWPLSYCDACYPYHRGVHDRRERYYRKNLEKISKITDNLKIAYDKMSSDDQARILQKSLRNLAKSVRDHSKYGKGKKKHAVEILRRFISND